MSKIKNIEFFRFVFALVVCYYHLIINWAKIYPENELFLHLKYVANGGFCVDLFFIIAGYFLFFSLEKTQSVLDFTLHKIKRLFPPLAFSIITITCLKKVAFSKIALNLLFLQSTALSYQMVVNTAAWFVSALLIVSVFYAGVVKSFPKTQGLFFISISCFLAYSYMLRAIGGVGELANFFLMNGTIRGLAGTALGYLLAEVLLRKGQAISNFLSSSIFSRCLTTMFEITASILIIYYVICGRDFVQSYILMVVLFVVLFVTLIYRQGYFSRILDNNISAFLGKYAFSIYIMQAAYNAYARKNFWKDYAFISEHFALAVFLNLLGYTLLGVITYHLVENPPMFIKKIIQKENKCINQ